MIKINKESIIYILCPANFQTGGTELAHQLVDFLLSKKQNAYIVYIDNNNYKKAETPEGFKKYNIRVAIEPIDDANNVLIIPEIYFSFIKKVNQIQFVFWWMSVDNFFTRTPLYQVLQFCGIYTALKVSYNRYKIKQNIFGGVSLKKINHLENNFLHVYQSTYAKCFLLGKNVNQILPLSDYINSDLLAQQNENLNKENIILYNPAKGIRFTKKIIKLLPKYKFVALEKFTRSELSEYLKISKLYIDFGNHPGKDRLPREAVLNNCCILVGKKGSAKYFEDIPIPDKYKFEEKDLFLIINEIKNIILNYDNCKLDFQFYKKRILLEKNKFHNEIEEIFNI